MGHKHLTPHQRQEIAGRRERGEAVKAIARSMGISPKAVRNAGKLLAETGGFADRPHSGRPPATTARVDRLLHRMSEADRKLTAADVRSRMLADHGLPLSLSTVQRRLRSFGLWSRIARRKTMISKANRKRRVRWAVQYRNWTEQDWSRVLWTDEARFYRTGFNVRQLVRRRSHEAMAPRCVGGTVRGGGGSTMVWGALSALGTGPLVQILGTMDAACYVDVLQQHALPLVTQFEGNVVWQQDNAPPHTARTTRQWLQDRAWTVMDWPPQSPDLSPIENVWSLVARAVRRAAPSTVQDLWACVASAWQALPPLQCRRLVNSMPRRVAAVLRARGGPIGY